MLTEREEISPSCGVPLSVRLMPTREIPIFSRGIPPAQSGCRRQRRQILQLSNRGNIAVLIGDNGDKLIVRTHQINDGAMIHGVAAVPGGKYHAVPGPEGEIKRANDMRAGGHSYPTIDKALGRRPGATQHAEIAGNGSKDQVKSFRVPDYLLAERDALAVAREQRALTGYFCGDPPPGYSAPHGKTGLR
jgi:hypothetical protein